MLRKVVRIRPAILNDLSIIAQLYRNDETVLKLDKRIEVRYDCQNHKGRSRVTYAPE